MKSYKLLLVITAVFLISLFIPQQTAAHAVPISSDPLPNRILDEGPAQLTIFFNEPIVPQFSRIRVLTQTGQAIDVGDGIASDGNRNLTISLPPLNEGAYLVSWQALSAVDGHTTSGTFSFGVGDVVLDGDEASSVLADISPFSAAARWLTLTGLALLIGFFSFHLLVWRPLFAGVEMEADEVDLDQTTVTAGLRVVYVGLTLLLIALGLTLYDQATAFRLWEAGNWQPWLATQFGQMWLLRLLLWLPMLGLVIGLNKMVKQHDSTPGSWPSSWLWLAGLLLSIGLAATSSMISHSAALAQDTWQAIGVDLAHTVAAGVWAGGLLFLALALFQARRLEVDLKTWLNLSLILNFSAVAALSIGVLIFSGAYLAGKHVGTWTALVGTAYGLVLLGKLAVALVAFGLAAINLLIIKPRLNAAYDTPDTPQATQTRRRFRTIVTAEAVLGLIILAAAGLLSDLQRGVDAPLLADAPGQMITEAAAGDLLIELAIEPALVGQNSFVVTVHDEQGNLVTDVEEVLFRFTFLGQSLGSEESIAELGENGRYHLHGSYISLIGSWQVEVSVRRPGHFDAFAPYRLEAGLGGEIRPLEQRTPLPQAIAHWMTLASGGGTGLLLMVVALIWAGAAARAAQTAWQLAPMLLLAVFVFGVGANQMIDYFTNEYTPATFLNNPVLPDAESVAIGEFYYQQYCAVCHGDGGRGDGPAGLALSPRPADFGDGHLNIHPDGDLYYWIRNGIEGTVMPGFGERLSNEDTWHLVNYLRRLSVQAQAEYGAE